MNKKTIKPKSISKSLEHTHGDLYPQIGSKLISNLLKSKFVPNQFGMDLSFFACIHIMTKSIGIGSKSIWKSHLNRVLDGEGGGREGGGNR